MNIGFLGPAVATVLTVYGIETCSIDYCIDKPNYRGILLQQYLPFTVLKLSIFEGIAVMYVQVATVLTVYGIETHERMHQDHHLLSQVATVLTVYGIETQHSNLDI